MTTAQFYLTAYRGESPKGMLVDRKPFLTLEDALTWVEANCVRCRSQHVPLRWTTETQNGRVVHLHIIQPSTARQSAERLIEADRRTYEWINDVDEVLIEGRSAAFAARFEEVMEGNHPAPMADRVTQGETK